MYIGIGDHRTMFSKSFQFKKMRAETELPLPLDITRPKTNTPVTTTTGLSLNAEPTLDMIGGDSKLKTGNTRRANCGTTRHEIKYNLYVLYNGFFTFRQMMYKSLRHLQ